MWMDFERLAQAARALEPTIDLFIVAVVNEGLMDRVDESRKKGMSGRFDGVALRTWCMAGRVMITLESEGGTVTLLGREEHRDESMRRYPDLGPFGDPRNPYGVGLHSIGCTNAAAIHMLHRVATNWPPDADEQRRIYKDDTGVTLDVLAGLPTTGESE